jgi:colanic acid/amylovoran biosynthesis glycosyltransferase
VKIAYLVSLYPAVSHTFILREVLALRRLGAEIGTFSIRTPSAGEILGPEAAAEAARTFNILPIGPARAFRALLWSALRRPRAASREFHARVLSRSGAKAKIMWTAYFLEGLVLARFLSEGGFEHLHCHFGNSGSNVALVAAKVAGISLSITCHGSELNDVAGNRLSEKVAESAFVACVSKNGKARLMLACPRSDWRKLRVVRCGLPALEAEEPAPRPEGAPELLCVGRLSPEKGHFVLLEAMDILRARGVPARLTVVGGGPLRDELIARTKELGLADAVEFLGPLESVEVAKRYRSCFATVLASFSEGVPVVLMEAFSHGKPVIATNVGGVAELVDDGVSGYVVPPGDASDLAEAIGKLLADPASAEEMGRRGAEKVMSAFSESVSAAELWSLFESAIRGRQG